MEKKKIKNIENGIDSKHHHHMNRQRSIPEKISLKYYNLKDGIKYQNKININDIFKNSKKSNNKANPENQKSYKKEKKHQHHHLQRNRSTNMFNNSKEQEYMRYKLENFGKKNKNEKNSQKRYILKNNFDNNMPKNVDKNTEKYFKPKNKNNISNHILENISKNKEKDIYDEKMKTQYIQEEFINKINENNGREKDNNKDKIKDKNKENFKENKLNNSNSGYLFQTTYKNKYKDNEENSLDNNNNSINYIQKNKDKEKYKVKNNERIIQNKEKTKKGKYYRDSIFNKDLNIKMKSKYFKNNESKNKEENVIEGEININQNNYENNENNNKEIKEKINYDIDEQISRRRDRKISMKISSKYSDKMKNQIVEERLKIMEEQKNLEKRKNDLYHMEEIKKKESFAQEHFIKTFLSNLSPYVDFGRINSRLPGGYLFLQSKLIYLDLACTEEQFNYVYNKKNFYKSKNAKDLCRKGISLKYMKIFFKKLLNIENYKENYELKYSMTIKSIDPKQLGDYVPYFCGKDKKVLNEVLPVHYLNENGITSLKVILWLISDLVPKIEYCPLLVKICSIFLIFLEKEEAYEAMRTLIEMNYNPSEIYKLRWHFRFSIMENEKICDSIRIFLENESPNMKNLFDYFRLNKLDPNVLIKDFCEGLFLNYLNFYGILRFICIYIYEGTKSLYRFIYGLLNYIYEVKFEEIKNTKNNLIRKIREIINGITDYKKIIEDSFNLQVSRFNNGYIKNNLGEDVEELIKPIEAPSIYNTNTENENESLNENKNDIKIKEKNRENDYIYDFYLPRIEPKSNILNTQEILQLWEKLPKNMKHKDLITIYTLSKKKINMKSIIILSEKYDKNYSILLIIETEQNELFGAIMPKMLRKTEEKEYIELDNCYLVKFRPKVKLYKDTYSKGINMLCCNKKGLWFCKQDVGDLFYIDGTLSEGRTCKDNTYFGKVSLTQKDNFLVKDLEIIVFVENNA